jgi:subtilisin family serine protease
VTSIRGVVCASALAAAGALIATPAYAEPAGQVVPAARAPIAGQYVVVFNDSVTDVVGTARRLAGSSKLLHTYRSALKGFAVKATPRQAARIAADRAVSSVQQDSLVRISGDVGAAATQAIPAPPETYWGLNRIDQRALPPNAAGTYEYSFTALNTTAYVVDTGLNYTHNDFGTRASFGADTVGGINPPGSDCHGHGTHVGATIGGTVYGVAKAVKLKAVRVLDCGGSGSAAGVIAGLDWIRANAVRPAVVNMSLGGGALMAMNIATNDLVEAGITVVAAAGNWNDDACNYSPSSALSAITVGSTGNYEDGNAPISDERSSFSNHGPCLDIFAPGAHIKSAWIGSDTATSTISGTSMASPHVAGVAALYLSKAPTALPATVRNALVAFSTKDVVTDPGAGSPNRLLYSGGPAVLTLDAAPEPVGRGGAVTSVGRLTIGGMALARQPVQIWFDPAGAATAVLHGTTTTSATGRYRATFNQSADGTWFARFLGAPLVGANRSSLDFVDCFDC